MKHIIVPTVICLIFCLSVRIQGAVAPPAGEQEERFPIIRREDGKVRVEDPFNQFKLSLPATYWECKTPEELKGQGGSATGGCSPGGGMPEGLLLVVRNQDTRAAASLELKKERFRVQGKEDLEEYLEERQSKFMERGSFEVEESGYEEGDGIIVHRTTLSTTGEEADQKYILVDFFVRPEDQKARAYQLVCISTPDNFDRVEDDFEYIINSFEYTAPVADNFFTPGASPEELPEVEEQTNPLGGCGGQYSGMFLAMVAVFFVYMFFRTRSKKR